MNIERVFAVYARYQEYLSLRCYGATKRYARVGAGISRYYVNKCEEAEETAMLNGPAAVRSTNAIPF